MWLLKLESVVAATDLKEASRSALSTAARLAALASAALHVVFVEEAPTRDAEARVREELEVAAPGAGEPASVVVMSGDAARAIVNRAVQVEADAIVLGPHARAVHQPGEMGGTAAAVVRSASCPCLVAARDLHLPLRNVLAPVDRSEAAEGTLSVALSWTSALRPRGGTARLTAFHASPAGPEREAASEIRAAVERARDLAGRAAQVVIQDLVVESEDPATEILRQARGSADLMVMGTHRARQTTSGLGGISAAVARQTPCPVLFVPPDVWREHAGVVPGGFDPNP